MPARRNGRKFFPICSYPPTIKSKVSRTPKFTLSAPNKAKAYADDLSIISGSLEEHTEMVQTIDQLSREIDLIKCPDKCVTLVFDGKKITELNSQMAGWDKYLKEPQNSLVQQLQPPISTQLQKLRNNWRRSPYIVLISIDSRPIRGDYNVWIFQNYVVPSSRFLLTVDPISDNGIRSIQSTATKFIKNGSDFPEMQRKWSFTTQRSSIVHIFQPRGWRRKSPN